MTIPDKDLREIELALSQDYEEGAIEVAIPYFDTRDEAVDAVLEIARRLQLNGVEPLHPKESQNGSALKSPEGYLP